MVHVLGDGWAFGSERASDLVTERRGAGNPVVRLANGIREVCVCVCIGNTEPGEDGDALHSQHHLTFSLNLAASLWHGPAMSLHRRSNYNSGWLCQSETTEWWFFVVWTKYFYILNKKISISFWKCRSVKQVWWNIAKAFIQAEWPIVLWEVRICL